MEVLEDAVLQIWGEEVPKYCQALCESFRGKFQKCLELNGYEIKNKASPMSEQSGLPGTVVALSSLN